MDILAILLSGLIGSLIGAFIGARATLKATKITLKGLYEYEQEKREFESKQQNLIVIHALLKELIENQSIADAVQNKSFKHVVMSREAWSIYKGSTSFMAKELQMSLPFIYSLIAEYNSILEYDKAYLSHGAGHHNDRIIESARQFKDNAGEIIAELENLLKR